MDVKQIQIMLDSIDEEAKLQHIWTKQGGVIEGRQRFVTTLYFRQNGVKIEVPLEHFKDVKEEDKIYKVPKENLTQKLGNFFKSNDSGISP